ncbi:hypothetical protein [Agarivorans aestuarii]|nr:hypothetical protein [Agarivorans aestuarii]
MSEWKGESVELTINAAVEMGLDLSSINAELANKKHKLGSNLKRVP